MKPPIDNDQLAAEYAAGMGLRELGRKYQRSHQAILYRLHRMGVPMRVAGAPMGNKNAKGRPPTQRSE